MSSARQPSESSREADALAEAKARESHIRGDQTNAAERAKTIAQNRLTYPSWAGAQYAAHQSPTQETLSAGTGSTGAAPESGGGYYNTPDGEYHTTVRTPGLPFGITGSWEPMNNLDGSFNPFSSQRPLPTQSPVARQQDRINGALLASGPTPARGIHPTTNARDLLVGNDGVYRVHEPPSPTGVNSPLIQDQLDAVAGVTQHPAPNIGAQMTPYGIVIGTSTPQPAPIAAGAAAPEGTIHPMADDPIGNADARRALQQSHPEVFQFGTPENAGFTAYAQRYGEAEAHKNIGTIMDLVPKPIPVAATPPPAPVLPKPTRNTSIEGAEGSAPVSVPRTKQELNPYS